MNYNELQTSDAIPISKINSAALINFRIDAIIKDATRHARAGQYAKWNDDLDRLWLELGSDVKEDSEEEKKFEKLDGAYHEQLKEKPVVKTGFETYTQEDYLRFGKIKKTLMEKEMFLRRLINKQGKGTAYDDGEDEEL